MQSAVGFCVGKCFDSRHHGYRIDGIEELV